MANQQFFLFHGNDDYTSLENLKSWVTVFKKKYPESSLIFINADEVSYFDFLKDIESRATAGSLFDEIKLVVVKRINAYLNNKSYNLQSLTKVLDLIPKKTFLVFWADGEVNQKSELVNYFNKGAQSKVKHFSKPESANGFNSWLEKAATSKNLTLSSSDLNLLAQYFGRDLIRKSNREILLPFNLGEITTYLEAISASLAVESDTKKVITDLVTPKVNPIIFDLTDLIIKQNTHASLDKLELLIKIYDPIEISAIIYWQFRIILKIIAARELKNLDSETMRVSKLSYFLYNKAQSMAQKISVDQIEIIYQILLEHDYRQKSGYDPNWLLDLLIIKLCQIDFTSNAPKPFQQ